MTTNKICDTFSYHNLYNLDLIQLKSILTECSIEKPYSNSVGQTFADWTLKHLLTDHDTLTYLNQPILQYAYSAFRFITRQFGFNKFPTSLIHVKEDFIPSDLLEKVDLLKSLVNSDWFNKKHAEILGLSDLDIAFIKQDKTQIIATLYTGPNICELSPTASAQYLKGLKVADDLDVYYTMASHPNFCISSSYIKINNPLAPTMLVITGPGGTSWNYSYLKYFSENFAENKGMNIVMIGDGDNAISLTDIETTLKKAAPGIMGELFVSIHAHGIAIDDMHYISLDNYDDATETSSLFKTFNNIFFDKPLQIFFESCYSGMAIIDKSISMSSNLKMFTSASPFESSNSGTTKLSYNNLDSYFKANPEDDFSLKNWILAHVRGTCFLKDCDIKKSSPTYTEVDTNVKISLSLGALYLHQNFTNTMSEYSERIASEYKDFFNKSLPSIENLNSKENIEIALLEAYLVYENIKNFKQIQCANTAESLFVEPECNYDSILTLGYMQFYGREIDGITTFTIL